MIIATMPDLGNLVSMSSLTLSRCTNNTSRPNCDLGDPGSAKEAETPFLMQDQSSRQKCVKIKKSVESKSTDDYLGDWVAKNVELGIPESKLFLPFLVGAPKLAECLVCESVIYPGEEVACVVRDCKGSYHLTCARDWLGLSPSSKSFKCPQHACFLCKKKIHLWRCSRCHLASHDKCAAYPEYVLRSNDLPSQTVCWRHATDWPPLKPAVPTNNIEELFGRIPLPYMVEEFKIDPMLKDTMENKLEPPPYVHIRRNIYLVKKKRYDTNRSIGCTDCSSSTCSEDCVCRLQCISCSKACRCSEICTNKPFRKDKKIKIVLTDSCGWGVEAAEAIKKGEFIIEYVGEVISDALCEQRLWDMKHQGIKNFYMCEIRKDFTIDATFKGNASRFLNHSCGPNCNLEKWDVDGETRVGVFAARSIKAGEPLTYDYRFVQFGAEVKCHCGASSCQGYLGTKKKMAKLELLDWGAKRRRTTTATIRT
ncbi:histone-lysine N-methyltransferase ASHR3 isoform X1 [Cynara cardunculus var. scolymus]|uniref:histone-lysine N-methyltransferase ASHR3 isoform X1 n=2 Tax=Cynara cardunculus var. scolymus TaxID=59895 RepID=UPI000D62D3CC|nr:histone-lysine N-methyltransferase ASHR3 isoform X1 [Cynara cardunculus var. scolymus]